MSRVNQLAPVGDTLPRRGLYLLHFDRRLAHAGHSLGFGKDISARLAQHDAGAGARLTQVCRERSIGWTVSAVWPNGTRTDERRLKRNGSSVRYCPTCRTAR